MADLNAAPLNSACGALPPELSDDLSHETVTWRRTFAATLNPAATDTDPRRVAPTTPSASTPAPNSSATGQGAAPDPVQPESLPPGSLSAAAYEKVGARNRYLAGKYDPNSWLDRVLNVFTGAMKDPANVLTASEWSEHRILSTKIVEKLFPQPTADEARLGAMVSSPIGTIAWLATREAGGSQRVQDFALGIGRSAEGIAMVAGPGAGIRFLNAQTELLISEAGKAATNVGRAANAAGNGAKTAAGSKADKTATFFESPGPRGSKEAPRTPGLGERASMSELVKSGAVPGTQGVILTDKVGGDPACLYGDIFRLSQKIGVEFALTREHGELVLRSGEYGRVRIPLLAEQIAHTHPLGSRKPSAADIRALNKWWEAFPYRSRPSADIIWGTEPDQVTRYSATRSPS